MRSSSMMRLLARLAACGAVVGAMLAAPASALADGSLTLSVGSEQVAGMPVTYKATGTVPAADVGGSNAPALWVYVRPSSLGPCGSDWWNDPKEDANGHGTVLDAQMTQLGAPSFAYSWTIPGIARTGGTTDTLTSPLGPYLVCGWLDDSQSTTPEATATASFTLRAPRFTMSVSAPNRPRLHHRGMFAVRGTSEIPAHLTVEALPACFGLRNTPAGIRCASHPLRSCQATPEAESNYIGEHNDLGIEAVTLISKEIPRGRFSLKRTVTFGHGWIPARHMVCAWIGITNNDANSSSDAVYLATSATVSPRP